MTQQIGITSLQNTYECNKNPEKQTLNRPETCTRKNGPRKKTGQ